MEEPTAPGQPEAPPAENEIARLFKSAQERVSSGLSWYSSRLRSSFATQVATIVSFFAILCLVVILILLSAFSTSNLDQVRQQSVSVHAPKKVLPVELLTDPLTALQTKMTFRMPTIRFIPSRTSLYILCFLLAIYTAVSLCIWVAQRSSEHEPFTDSNIEPQQDILTPGYHVSWISGIAFVTVLVYFSSQAHQRIQYYRHIQSQMDSSDQLVSTALRVIKEEIDVAQFNDLFGSDFLGEFEIAEQPLARGSFGAVYKGRRKSDNTTVAVKRIPLFFENDADGNPTDAMIKRTIQEAVLTTRLGENEHLLHIQKAFLVGSELWLVMDFIVGDELHDLIREKRRRREDGQFRSLPEPIIANLIKQVLLGIDHLHRHHIIHRDIKPNNWMYSRANGVLKIIDLGTAIRLHSSSEHVHDKIGTRLYMAPELFRSKGYSLPVDIWAVGISVLQMFRGEPPRKYLSPSEQLKELEHDPVPPFGPTHGDDDMTGECADFVRRCLTVNEVQRATTSELLQHPFLKKACSQQTLTEYFSPHL